MPLDLTVPDWLEQKLHIWVDRLQMWDWTIKLRLELVIDNDGEVRGQAHPSPDINCGRIVLRSDVEDDEEWEITLVHELLHIKHGRIDDVLEHVLLPELDGIPTIFGINVYRQVYEPFIDSLSKALVKMSRAEQSDA